MKTLLKKISNRKTIIRLSMITILLFSISCKTDECCEYLTDEFPFPCDGGMDVAFLIDYTGSMGGAIDGIKTSVGSIASTIVSESGGDYRLSLSIFDEYEKDANPIYFSQTDYTTLPASQKKVITTGTTTDQYLTMMEPFGTANQTSFSTQLAKLNSTMSLGSGMGWAEPGGLLFNEILNNAFAGSWRNGITKLAIIITDAPAGGDDDNNDAIDDAFLANLGIQASGNIQIILVTTLPSSNYEIQLVGNNTLGVAQVVPNFNNIATDIITLIENICDNNSM